MELQFTGEIWYWRGPSPFHFVTVPQEESEFVQSISALVTYGWGMIPVRATIARTTWDTSLFAKDGGYVLPVRASVRHREHLGLGDDVAVVIEVGSLR